MLTQRVIATLGRGVHVLYPADMPPRPAAIDKDAWAALLRELIQQETGGNKAQFAVNIRVDRRTVTRWLAGDVSVSEESVRTVARELGLPIGDLLVKLGYYTEADLPSEPIAERLVVEDDDAIKLIRESGAPPSLKRELIEHLLAQRAEHERQRLAEAERMLAIAMRGRKRAV